MESKLAALYNELTQKVISMIPVSWETVYFLGEVEKGKSSWSSVFYFKETGSEEFIKSHNIPDNYDVSEDTYDELLDEACEILLKIYDCFLENSKEPWEQLSLTVNSTGSFNIDYFYDKISNSGKGPMEREIIWAYDTFGNIPKDGTFSRKLLDEYLEQKNKNKS